MKLQTSPLMTVTCAGYGTPERPLIYERGEHQGKIIEFATLVCQETGDTFSATISPDLNGASEPLRSVGNMVSLTLSESTRDGKTKKKIVGVQKVDAPAAAKAA